MYSNHQDEYGTIYMENSEVLLLSRRGTCFLLFMVCDFLNLFITQTVDTKCTKISYKIVPATNFTV